MARSFADTYVPAKILTEVGRSKAENGGYIRRSSSAHRQRLRGKKREVKRGGYLIAASSLRFTSSQFTMFQKASTNLALSFL